MSIILRPNPKRPRFTKLPRKVLFQAEEDNDDEEYEEPDSLEFEEDSW